MKTIQELNRINNSLKKYTTMPVLQEKVDKANEMLRTIGLPKPVIKITHNSNKTNCEHKVYHA